MKVWQTLYLAALLASVLVGTAQAEEDTIKIGYYNNADALFKVNVLKDVLEQEMDRDVELVFTNPGAMFHGVASGETDFITDMWLPYTHKKYYEKIKDDVVNLGPIHMGARLGWAVPEYVPESKLNSIEDLASPEVKEKLGGRITGIDPGGGLTMLSEDTLKAYGLDDKGYHLQTSSGPAMVASLKKAVQEKEWIVVTAWNPHWLWAKWDVRYLNDPKKELGEGEHVDIVARDDLYQDEPRLFQMLDRVTIPLEDIEKGQYVGEQSSYEEAAQEYVDNHPRRVDYWVTGSFPE